MDDEQPQTFENIQKNPPQDPSKSRKKRRLQSVKMSRKHNIIGIAVLLVGLLAFVGVGWFAYSNFFSEEAQVEQAQKNRQKEIQRKIERGEIKRQSLRPKKIEEVSQSLTTLKAQPRQPKISFSSMDGQWIANTKAGVALLRIGRDSKYRIVFINDGENGQRLYSEGTFSKRGDILYFTPDRKFKPPKSIKGKRINSRKLTASPFPVMAAKHGDNIIWTRPTREASRAAKVFTPNQHAVLNKVQQEIVVWKRMK